MRFYIEHEGQQLPVDYSVMTALELAEAYNTDVTGLQATVGKFSQREQFGFVVTLARIALNDGARREGIERRYTEFDVRDMLTRDMSLGGRVVQDFFSTMQGEEVFPEPSGKAATRKKRSVANTE